MRGVVSAAGYLPHHRLDRSAITDFVGKGGGRGTRAVASYDEDTTTLGVEAARLALRSAPEGAMPGQVWFATAEPAYLEKTNATTIHAALRLDRDRPALDVGGAVRSGIGALRAALQGGGSTLLVASGLRTGLPGSADESGGGDGAAAILVGDDADGVGPVIAELVAAASATEEFLDRWRLPGDVRTKQWEERFGETKYLPLADDAWNAALKSAELSPAEIDRVVVTGVHPRAVKGVARRLGTIETAAVDDLSATVGNTGAAHPLLLLTSALENAEPGQRIAVVMLADGVEVLVLRATDAVTEWRPARPIAGQAGATAAVSYGKFLAWRDQLELDPPRRPAPDRISASVVGRTDDWKYGFVGSRDRSSGALHLPPARVSFEGGAVDDMEAVPMADVVGTVVTHTVDRIAYSPSPPIVFAIVDFDGGGRYPVELTDVDADSVAIGDRIEMTFRRLFTADGIHNYFWKGRPVRG